MTIDPDALIARMTESAHDHASELAADFLELDTWLRRGGFLPRLWQRDEIQVKAAMDIAEGEDNE